MSISIIATLYSYEPVIASVTKMGANNLFLLIDHNPDEIQKKAIEEVKKTLGKYVNIKLIKTDVYDIVEVAKDSVNLIDSLPKETKILLNVSAARKTKAMGLMFAGYSRFGKIEKIFYVTKEKQEVVLLPKLSFNLNKSHKRVLEYFDKEKEHRVIRDMYNGLNMSKSMFYKTLNELKDKGFINNNQITEAGRIALL